MVAKNDITGDQISSKVATESYRSNYDTIFGKKRKDCGGNCHTCIETFDHHEYVANCKIPVAKMVLCPFCGNKRCPKATDHELKCTGSNDPGQEGSIY